MSGFWRLPGDLRQLPLVAKDILEELKAVRALVGPPAAVRLVFTANSAGITMLVLVVASGRYAPLTLMRVRSDRLNPPLQEARSRYGDFGVAARTGTAEMEQDDFLESR